MFCCDALDALFFFLLFYWLAVGCSTFDVLYLQISLSFFFFPVLRAATLTGEPFRLYFSFSFCLTYVHLLLLVGIIRRFFFPPFFFFSLSGEFMCSCSFSLVLLCYERRDLFFFPLVCRFAAFMVLHHCLGLDTYTHLEHQQQQQKGSFKLESKNWEREKKKNTSVGDCGSDVTLTAPAYPRRTEGAEELL